MSSTLSVPEHLPRDPHELLDAERRRIARELHDVVAYSFATINVHAGVAAHVADRRPEQAFEALQAIKAISGEASREVREILGLIAPPRDAGHAGLAVTRLEALAATMTAAGLATRVVVSGSPHPVAPAVDRAAYRIAQEALTNALRHAGPASATVTVTHEPGLLIVDVFDDGRGSPAGRGSREPGGGNGIPGMRDRALGVGGRLEAGPVATGGFRVRAELPAGGAS